MANEEQLSILREGVQAWNRWRYKNPKTSIDLLKADLRKAKLKEANLGDAILIEADLSGANLSFANLNGANLTGANLRKVNFSQAKLNKADLSNVDLGEGTLVGADLRKTNFFEASLIGANLQEAKLKQANLSGADLTSANLYRASLKDADLSKANLTDANLCLATLRRAIFSGANLENAKLSRADLSQAKLNNANLIRAKLNGAGLNGANLSGANLTGAVLSQASLVSTRIDKAKLSESWIYAVNVWDLKGEFGEQKDLVITPYGKAAITVDNIKVAQFVYLLLNNQELRDAINTLTSKTVLILGRFAIPERKAILDALRNKLREYDLLPIVFDFERPTDKDFTETIKTLAGISYFVIADVTNPKSSPLELQATVPDYQIPFVPIIQEGESPFAMMVDLQKKYPWVLPTKSYDSIDTLMKTLKPGIIDPAVEMRNKLRIIKSQEHPTESLRDYLDKTL